MSVDRIAEALRGIAAQEAHTPDCTYGKRRELENWPGEYVIQGCSGCNRPERIVRRQAEAVEAAIGAGIKYSRSTTTTPIEPYPVLVLIEEAYDVALGALEGSGERKGT